MAVKKRKPRSDKGIKKPVEIDSRSKEILATEIKLRIAELEAQNQKYEEENKIEFFKPLPHQQTFINNIRTDGVKTSLLIGANQIGKTIACVNMVGAFSLGCEAPWDKLPIFPSDAARLSHGRGVIGRILCNDWEKAARDTIVPKLKEWLPVGSYETKKNNVGVEHEWTFPKTGSKFTILTYKEDTMSHMGWTGDWVHADEPPPRDKYIANRRGLIAHNGIFTIAMTAITQPWILDEIVEVPDKSTRIVANIKQKDNVYLTEEARRIFTAALSDDEKVAMVDGGWLQLTGRVWKGFRQQPVVLESGTVLIAHVVEPDTIPPDWPVEFQIDFHLNEPHAISFCACDPLGRFFIIDEVWEHCGSEALADRIITLKEKHHWRLKRGQIDPLSKGDTSYVKNRFGQVDSSFTIIERKLRKYGISLKSGSKDEKSYVTAVEERFKGKNGIPTLYIFNTCKETIKQVSRWAYDDNGSPKSDGHFPECIGRFTQSGLKYTDPTLYSQPLNLASCPI